MTALFDVRSRRRLSASLRIAALLGGIAVTGVASVPAASAQTAKTPAPAAKPAPVSSDPATTSASYGDWLLRCQKVGDADKAQRLCEVSQTIQAQGQQQPIAEVALGRLPNDPALRITVALPPSISFPSTVEISSPAPAPQSVQLQWKRCLPGGCFAETIPADESIRVWRAQTGAGKLAFKDAGGRDVVLPVSFRGLSQSLDALGK